MKKIGLFILFLGCLWFMGLGVFDYQINHLNSDLETKTDAIVVLTGGRHRLSEAVNLFNKGMSEHLFISGVPANISLKELKRRSDIKVATKRKITLDKIATNTFENARETSSWMEKNNINSIRLVTSNYHMFRSLVEFRRWNRNIEIIMHPVYSEKVATSWWKSFDSFVFLAAEYNKFLFAFVRAMCFDV